MSVQPRPGDLLRKARQELGLSLRDMAKLVSFSRSYLADIETSKVPAPTGVIQAYAKVREAHNMHRRTLLGALAATSLGLPDDPASAETAMRYGLWLGDQGKLREADTWYNVATALADRTGDKSTRGFVRARIATRGHYEGWSAAKVKDAIAEALSISQHGRVVVESQAAMVQLHTREGNLTAAQEAGKAMLAAAGTEDENVRAAVFVNYLECMLCNPRNATRVYDSFGTELAANPVWHVEANVYLGMAQVRAGDRNGVTMALESIRTLRSDVRMIGVGVTDLLSHVSWDSAEVAELRTFARV